MGGNNRNSELVMHKAETYTRNINLTTCNVNARGTEMGVQPDRYRVRRKGLSLCQLPLSAGLREHLETLGVVTGERLYDLMLHSPKAMKTLLAQHNETLEHVSSMLRSKLSPDAVARIELTPVEDYATGLLDEKQAM